LKRTLLSVKSIAYSESATGFYLETELFSRLGIADEMKSKKKTVPGLSVTDVVARGEAEIGFQQVSEWKAAHGVDYVGPLPSDVQKMTMFSAGVAAGAANSLAASALIDFLASPAAARVITETGLVPVMRAGKQ
jgi:molybdate transport system substrate-binding protein